jgi:hypothetical protein
MISFKSELNIFTAIPTVKGRKPKFLIFIKEILKKAVPNKHHRAGIRNLDKGKLVNIFRLENEKLAIKAIAYIINKYLKGGWVHVQFKYLENEKIRG